MPVIGKFKVKCKGTVILDTAVHVFSYLVFPNDEQKRLGYLSHWAGVGRDIMRDATRDVVARDLSAMYGKQQALPLHLISDQYFKICQRRVMENASLYQDTFGGMTTAALLPHTDKLQNEVDRAFYNCMRVGILFRMVTDFSAYYGEAVSLEKVFPVFIEHPAFYQLRCTNSRHKQYTFRMLRDLWEEYRKVAHLCAALSWQAVHDSRHYIQWKKVGIEPFGTDHRYILMAQFFYKVDVLERLAQYGHYLDFMQRNPFVQARLARKNNLFAFDSLAKTYHHLLTDGVSRDMFLGLAREYQRFGLNFKAKQSPHPLLHDDIWSVSEEWKLPRRLIPVSKPHSSMRAIYERHATRKSRIK